MPDTSTNATLLTDFLAGKRTALARAISVVENQRAGFEEMLAALHERLGRAQRIGMTGPPGAGKSTLTSALVQGFRKREETVGVVAVDPTSPFTGGALLGDRIRMGEVALDPGVYIRSMATRGSLGGLAVTTKEVVDVIDAFGFDRVLMETVGVGQSELDIAAAADTTVVMLVPESGDSIQAMKAGLMEISDIFVINKADRPGAERLAREVEMMLHLRSGKALGNVTGHHGVDKKAVAERRKSTGTSSPGKNDGETDASGSWRIPVLQTVAETGKGVAEVAAALDQHRAWLEASGELARRRQARLAERVREVVGRDYSEYVWQDRGGEAILREALPDLASGRSSPYEVAARIVRAAKGL
jgi:LAO/AO transport system kinase